MVLLSVCSSVAVVGVYISIMQNWSFCIGFVPLALKAHLYCKVYQNFSIIHIQYFAVGRDNTSTHLPGPWDAYTFHLLVNYGAMGTGISKLSLRILVFNSSAYISRDVTVRQYGNSECF